MKIIKKWSGLFIVALAFIVVGYCLHQDYRDRQAYETCLKQQSLDVTRNDVIKNYCYDAAQRGGYRE